MREHPHAGMSLYSSSGHRKYLNAAERRRFVKAADHADPATRLFCLVLGCSGGRSSEVLALTPASIDIESRVVSIVTLKRRKSGVVRQVPLPGDIVGDLNRLFRLRFAQRDPFLANRSLWTFSRTTAWRHVKAVMAAAGGTDSASTLSRRTFRRTLFSAGLVTRPCERRRSR